MPASAKPACTNSFRPNAGRNDGFTLIELMIAMLLMGLVIAGAISAMGSLFGSTGSAQIQQSVNMEIGEAVDQITSDLTRARADDRNNNDIRSPENLSDAVANGAALQSESPTSVPIGRPLMIDDVLKAGPNELIVMANVTPDAANKAECVRWSAAVAGNMWRLTREVYSAGDLTGCLGAVTDSTVVIDASTKQTPPAAIFEYQLVCNPATCGATATPGAGPCTPWRQATVTGTKLRWISAIDANLSSEAFRGDGGLASRGSATTITLRSRSTPEYRQAAGCA